MNSVNPKPLSQAALITSASFILGLIFNYFFYGKIPGIALPVYVLLVVTGLFLITAYLGQRISRQVLWLCAPLVFFSAMVFVRSSGFLTFLNIVACILLLLLIAKVSFTEKLKNFLINDYLKILILPFKFITPVFTTLADLFTWRRDIQNQKKIMPVVKGILMALPVLIIFLLLFSSADLVFQKYLSELININIKPNIIYQSGLILFVTLAFIGAYTYIFRPSEQITIKEPSKNNYSIGQIEIATFLGLIGALFLIFIIVQATYLFGGESNIAGQGFTYAEYARRGFFELILVAIISLLLLLNLEKYVIKKGTEHTWLFKILSSVLIIEVIFIMWSAFARLLIYEQAYGFTTSRLYSHAFIFWLGIIFGLLLYKIYRDNRESVFTFRVFLSIVLFLAVMNLLNPDAFIARQNIARFAATGKLDIYYLNRLSDDALPEIIKALDISNQDLSHSFARELYWRFQNSTDPSYHSKWQSLNLSRSRASQILNSKMAELEQYKAYESQNMDLMMIRGD